MLLTPCGVDFANTLLYHLKALQLSFFPFFLPSFTTLSEGYNTSSHYKHVKMEGPARTDSGLVVLVPPFISKGNWIRVNTANGDYMERVSGTR